MAARGTTPTPIKMGNLRRFPATERARRARLSRGLAARWLVPPTDGTVAEWQTWRSITNQCDVCSKKSYPRLHLVLNLYGAYTLWRVCHECDYIDEEPTVARAKVIAEGSRLDGWVLATGAQSLLEQRKQQSPRWQHPRAMTANYGRGGGDRGA